jgi:AcrR family transcriptional regulator
MRPDTLTRERIILATIDLLDDEGLEGLNMRALGKRLGSTTTAVYWHLSGKDELVALAGDHVWTEIVLADPDPSDWRAAAASMARGLFAMISLHPWLVQALGSHVVYGPGKARYDDRSLAIYEAAGFAGESADRAEATIVTFVLGSALSSAAVASVRRKLGRGGGGEQDAIDNMMARARDVASEFPRLRSRLETPSAEHGVGPEDSFEFGLAVILDGFEEQLRSS